MIWYTWPNCCQRSLNGIGSVFVAIRYHVACRLVGMTGSKRLVCFWLCLIPFTRNAFADEAQPTPSSASVSALPTLPSEEAKAAIQWAVYLVQSNLAPTYERKKNWDARKRIYAGIDIDNDGLKIKTHRKYREVRHGKWLRYTIDLKDPNDPRYLKIDVLRATSTEPGRLGLTLQIDTQVDVEAQQQRWNYGLQLYSVTTEATAKLRMTIDATIGFGIDYSRIPPDVLFDPTVNSADIQLLDLEVDKIGILGSDIAEEIGAVAERIIRDEYLPKQRDQLASKLNHQINRRRDKLRISASDWITTHLRTAPPR